MLPAEIDLGRLDSSYGALQGSVTVKNPNAFEIKDPEFICVITAASGTEIRRFRTVIYERVPANGRKTVRNHKFGYWPDQGKSIGCEGDLARRP